MYFPINFASVLILSHEIALQWPGDSLSVSAAMVSCGILPERSKLHQNQASTQQLLVPGKAALHVLDLV